MSKRNYSQYSSNKNKTVDVDEEVIDTVVDLEETPVEEPVVNVEATPEVDVVAEPEKPVVKSKPKTTTGIVSNCTKLNVRAEPEATAEILCLLDVNAEIKINMAKSNKDWFNVCTATGVEGYCMRKFVKTSL